MRLRSPCWRCVSATTRSSRAGCARRVARRQRPTRTQCSTAAGPSSSTGSSTGRTRLSPVQWTSERAGRYVRAAVRWAGLLTLGWTASGLRVSYGHDRVPAPDDPVAGGTAKFQKLAARFPNHSARFSLLYLGSTWLPRDLGPLLAYAGRRRIPVVLNQN